MIAKAEDTPVLVERRGHVLLVTINRPQARNAVNAAVHIGIGKALEEAEADPRIRVVILTGAGDKAFCAGADLVALARGDRITPQDKTQVAWGFAGFVQHPISKPVIAAVNGFALGGGTELALASDLVIAAETAQFGLPEVKRGILAAAGGAFRLVRQLPAKIAMEYLLTGEAFSATRAAELGLVNAVVSADRLLEEAFALADRIAINAPLAVQASKRIALRITNGQRADEETVWRQSSSEMMLVMKSQDAGEGLRAFAEKRAPAWKAQ